MQEVKYKGETQSFHNLITNKKIEIPIIQRDYAQGRASEEEIRKRFLKALFECVDQQKSIKLDFIYGTNKDASFQPLDGQQRLTTLFLLHWYAATKEGQITLLGSVLSNFSYETRITSREFCEALVQNLVRISEEDEYISNRIIDSSWFFLSWKNDPTIDAMLRTIDDIHKIFQSVENLWDRITKDDLISFYYVELENIGLTDDLYIKMNARGKLLTSFENFKARLQKHINDNNWEEGIDITDSFALKIDTSWTDYFWINFRKNNSVDKALIRFIASIAMIRQAIDRVHSKADDRYQLITNLQELPSFVKPSHFSEIGFKYLVATFNLYNVFVKRNDDVSLTYPLWRHTPGRSIISEIVYDDNVFSTLQVNTATYTQKVLFFAQTEYLLNVSDFDKDKYQDWMRVVRNIISRGDVDKDGNRPDVVRSPQTFDGAVNLINELSNGCSDIYKHLSEITNVKSQFSKDQIEEERKKANLVVANPALKALIFEAEDNELLRGRIDFIFYCIEYSGDTHSFDHSMFKKVSNVFSKYFADEKNDLNNDLRRAFLTIEVNGVFEFYNYWESYWYLVDATKRKLFDKFRELEYFMYSDFREYFKKLVIKLIDLDLKEIAIQFNTPTGFPNWKKRLIKEPELLDRTGKSKYIAIAGDNSYCYILKSKRPRDIDGSIRIE